MASAFEWVANHPALDFVNTVSWGREGLAHERLESYGDLLQWSREAETLPESVVDRLERQAAGNPRAAKQAIESARELRALLQEVFGEIARGKPRNPAAVARFNAVLAEALPHLRLTVPGRPLALDWADAPDTLSAPLRPLVWSAALLLSSDSLRRVGRCASDQCGWLFLDTSRSGRRRWCDMRDCGNRAKVRRHRRRA